MIYRKRRRQMKTRRRGTKTATMGAEALEYIGRNQVTIGLTAPAKGRKLPMRISPTRTTGNIKI